ncbi:MAG: DNA-formamidopyrimidine glycosylase family protein, partial [Acidimicrobiia bacterium]
MPEGLEAEIYRRHAERALHRDILTVTVDPAQPMAVELGRILPGLRFVAARRHGKLVLLDTAGNAGPGPTLGLHFGMTGRLIVDGGAAIDRLEYASGRDDPAWDRLVIELAPARGRRRSGVLRVNDPRRWARFDLDPDEGRLGPDFLTVDLAELAEGLRGRRVALKAILLDQGVVAGFGNLCVDEVLWQAGLAPSRPAGSLSDAELDLLHAAMVEHLPAML